MGDSDSRDPRRWGCVDLVTLAVFITAVATLIDVLRGWW